MNTPAQRLAQSILIVPAAHSRILDMRFQIEMYELFHQTLLCRLGHMICTPLVLLGALILASRIELAGATVTPASIYVATLAAFAISLDRRVGAVMIPLLAALLLLAHHLGAALGARATPAAIALMVAGSVFQTLSHMADAVPPPASGAPGWVPTRAWIKSSSLGQLIRVGALSATAFTLLEFWATFRIWPLQVLHLLLRLGYRPELRRTLHRRVEAIFAHPEIDWRNPRVAR